jgi:DNA-directed RNA polymerase subunit RPC12/RpoP
MPETITVQCNGCGASFKVPETYASNKFNCKKCGGIILIRRKTTTARRTSVTQVQARRSAPQKLSRATIISSLGMLTLIIAVVVFFLVK